MKPILGIRRWKDGLFYEHFLENEKPWRAFLIFVPPLIVLAPLAILFGLALFVMDLFALAWATICKPEEGK